MKYLPSIAVYGALAHSIYIVPLAVGLAIGYSKFSEEADRRQRVYDTYLTNERISAELEVKVKPHLEEIRFQREIATNDQYAKIGEILGGVEFDAGASLKREKFRKEPTRRQFAPDVQAIGEDYGIGFSGRYGALQSAALKLEMHRPNIFLTSFTLTAPADRRSLRSVA